jgi:protein SCO1/2
MKIRLGILVAVILLGFAAGIYFFRPHAFHGTVIQSPDPAFNFTLSGANGDVSLSDYRGKLVLIYFGYTFCPDICPATLANAAQALRELGPQAEEVQVIMISLDPERDTPEKLARYMAHFHPSFIGVTGTP